MLGIPMKLYKKGIENLQRQSTEELLAVLVHRVRGIILEDALEIRERQHAQHAHQLPLDHRPMDGHGTGLLDGIE